MTLNTIHREMVMCSPVNGIRICIFDKGLNVESDDLWGPGFSEPSVRTSWSWLIVDRSLILSPVCTTGHADVCVCVCVRFPTTALAAGHSGKALQRACPTLSSHRCHLALHNRPAALSHINDRDGGGKKGEKCLQQEGETTRRADRQRGREGESMYTEVQRGL